MTSTVITTINDIRKIIREELEKQQAPSSPILIGTASATIAGDERYRDEIKVLYDVQNDLVTVLRGSTGAVGGMDGPGGATEQSIEFEETTGPAPNGRDIIRLVKVAIDSDSVGVIKRYGKPTKNFMWIMKHDKLSFRPNYMAVDRGLSANKAQAALDNARSY